MIKTLKHFSLLFVFVFSMVSAEIKDDQYRLCVTMVDPEFHCFALSNHMVFNIPKKNWETDTLPEVGAEVYVHPKKRILGGRSSYNEEEDFVIRYSQDSMKKSITVGMTKDSEQYCLSYVSSESLCIQPARWITRDIYQNVLLLSDGSKWMLRKDAQVAFTPGDRIMVSKNQDDDYYRIINIDRSSFDCVRWTASGKAFTWYKHTLAKPYVSEKN